MTESGGIYRLSLYGAFRFNRPDGRRIDLSSKRGQALIAMLAVAGGGERTRSWLQDRLWGSRDATQAMASLRRELSTLRGILNGDGPELLHSDHSRVWLDLSRVNVDARKLDDAPEGEFLEGLDLVGEEGFEDWLREERALAEERKGTAPLSPKVATAVETDPAPFSVRPAVAILPFVNGTSEPANDFLAEGLSEDLIDRLSRLRWLPVIARSSSFALKDKALDAKAAGEALGARYVLDGQLRRSLTGLALSASLSDASSGEVVWSNRIDLPEEMTRDALAQLLAGLTTILDIRIDQQEQRRALDKPQSDLNVRELIWKGRWHLNRFTKEDAIIARECFDKALKIEPNSPEALIQATWTRLWDLWVMRGSQDEIKTVRQLAQRAIISDFDDARGHMLAGIAETWLSQPLRAEALLRKAIDLNPSLVLAHAQLGSGLYLAGDYAESADLLKFAIRLSPNDFTLFFILGELAMVHLLRGEHGDALMQAEHAISRRRGYWIAHVIKIVALVELGQLPDSQAAYRELLSVKPNFTRPYLDWIPFIDRSRNEFLKGRLNQAAS